MHEGGVNHLEAGVLPIKRQTQVGARQHNSVRASFDHGVRYINEKFPLFAVHSMYAILNSVGARTNGVTPVTAIAKTGWYVRLVLLVQTGKRREAGLCMSSRFCQ